MNHFAFIGTGPCVPKAILIAQIIQVVAMVGAVATIVWLVKGAQRNGSIKKVSTKLFLAAVIAIILAGTALIVFAVGISATCAGGWDGFLF